VIYGEMQKSPNGPNRKYYFLTDDGKQALDGFRAYWQEIKIPIEQLLEKRDEHERR